MKDLAVKLKHIGAEEDEPVVAVYLPHEERAIMRHISDAEARGIPRETVERELEVMHLLKAEFEAVLLP